MADRDFPHDIWQASTDIAGSTCLSDVDRDALADKIAAALSAERLGTLIAATKVVISTLAGSKDEILDSMRSARQR